MQIEVDADNEGNKNIYIYIQAKENMIWSDSFYEVNHCWTILKRYSTATSIAHIPPLKDLTREIPNGFIDTSNCRQGSLAASQLRCFRPGFLFSNLQQQHDDRSSTVHPINTKTINR